MSERRTAAEKIFGTRAEAFWMKHPVDEPEPWGEFVNHAAVWKFAEAYAQSELAAAQTENERLREALTAIIKDAPEVKDFEIGGKFDYDNGCGNADDVEYLGISREHFRLAEIARAALRSVEKK